MTLVLGAAALFWITYRGIAIFATRGGARGDRDDGRRGVARGTRGLRRHVDGRRRSSSRSVRTARRAGREEGSAAARSRDGSVSFDGEFMVLDVLVMKKRLHIDKPPHDDVTSGTTRTLMTLDSNGARKTMKRFAVVVFLLGCDKLLHREAPAASVEFPPPPVVTATSSETDAASPSLAAHADAGDDDDDDNPLAGLHSSEHAPTVDAASPACPYPIHPSYCRRSCRSRRALPSMHARPRLWLDAIGQRHVRRVQRLRRGRIQRGARRVLRRDDERARRRDRQEAERVQPLRDDPRVHADDRVDDARADRQRTQYDHAAAGSVPRTKMNFSRRSAFDATPNELASALLAKRARGDRVIDLTESNPTRAGIPYDEPAILAALARRISRLRTGAFRAPACARGDRRTRRRGRIARRADRYDERGVRIFFQAARAILATRCSRRYRAIRSLRSSRRSRA